MSSPLMACDNAYGMLHPLTFGAVLFGQWVGLLIASSYVNSEDVANISYIILDSLFSTFIIEEFSGLLVSLNELVFKKTIYQEKIGSSCSWYDFLKRQLTRMN